MSQFWTEFLTLAVHSLGARAAGLFRDEGSGGWRQVGGGFGDTSAWGGRFAERIEAVANESVATFEEPEGFLTVGRFGSGGERLSLLAFSPQEPAAERLSAFRTLLAVPGWQADSVILRRAGGAPEHLAAILDLVVILNEARQFRETALALVNELAVRLRCSRVALGWMDRRSARVVAISHTDVPDRRSDAVEALARRMEEASDQDCEVTVPPLEGFDGISAEHRERARELGGNGGLVTLPLRHRGQVVGALAMEREDSAFSATEIPLLRLITDLASPPLTRLREASRWFGVRWIAGLHRVAAFWMGQQHTGWKLAGVGLVVTLAVLLLVRITYRVEAPFILRASESVQVAAPFEGYLSAIHYEVGDAVEDGELLVAFRQEDLLLEFAELEARLREQRTAAQQARAANELAALAIAEAAVAEVEARLKRVRYRLEQATIRAPMAGIILEGDLREKVGAPFRQGDLLLRIAQLENLTIEIAVDERDAHELAEGRSGEIAFTSRPEEKVPVVITVIEPIAAVHDGANVFEVRAEPIAPPQAWWRPGLTGVVRIEVEERSLWWILTHETTDFLRLYFWL